MVPFNRPPNPYIPAEIERVINTGKTLIPEGLDLPLKIGPSP